MFVQVLSRSYVHDSNGWGEGTAVILYKHVLANASVDFYNHRGSTTTVIEHGQAGDLFCCY